MDIDPNDWLEGGDTPFADLCTDETEADIYSCDPQAADNDPCTLEDFHGIDDAVRYGLRDNRIQGSISQLEAFLPLSSCYDSPPFVADDLAEYTSGLDPCHGSNDPWTSRMQTIEDQEM